MDHPPSRVPTASFRAGPSTSLPATNAKRLRKGALATKQSILSLVRWIASVRSQWRP